MQISKQGAALTISVYINLKICNTKHRQNAS